MKYRLFYTALFRFYLEKEVGGQPQGEYLDIPSEGVIEFNEDNSEKALAKVQHIIDTKGAGNLPGAYWDGEKGWKVAGQVIGEGKNLIALSRKPEEIILRKLEEEKVVVEIKEVERKPDLLSQPFVKETAEIKNGGIAKLNNYRLKYKLVYVTSVGETPEGCYCEEKSVREEQPPDYFFPAPNLEIAQELANRFVDRQTRQKPNGPFPTPPVDGRDIRHNFYAKLINLDEELVQIT